MAKIKKMSLVQQKNKFGKAVQCYRDAIIAGFYSSRDKEDDGEKSKEKIIRLFKESPAATRDTLLVIIYETLTKRCQPYNNRSSLNDPNESASHLTNWLRDLACELADKLNKS
jgi:hypothetical protein